MTTTSPARARWAVYALFMLNGMVFGAWVPHVPLAKERLGVGPGLFGLALLMIAGGAVFSMPFTGALINKFGSARVLLVSSIICTIGVLGPIFAPGLWAFLPAAFIYGLGNGAMDVSMNAHGLVVEKQLQRPAMSFFHAGFSLGAMLGAFAGAYVLKEYGASVEAFSFVAVILAATLYACANLLPARVDQGLSESHFGWPTKATWALGALCYLALMMEGSVADWAGLFMQERFALAAAAAAMGFGFYQTGMCVARFMGDNLRQRAGAVTMVVASAALASAGTALALIAPTTEISLLGWALGGFGVGNLAPVLYAGGGKLEPSAPGRGIAAVVSMGYAGFLSGPPLIGFAAQLTRLQIGLGLTVLAGIIVMVFARAVAPADEY